MIVGSRAERGRPVPTPIVRWPHPGSRSGGAAFTGSRHGYGPIMRGATTDPPFVAEARRAGVTSERVLAALAIVPRDWFTLDDPEARLDRPVAIGHGQTTSQPSLVARILHELRIEPGMSVLEIGTGLGYEAALAALLAAPGGSVVTVERDARLADEARRRLRRLRDLPTDMPLDVDVRTADGMLGCSEQAPFDAIVVAAATDQVPAALFDQLADGGRMIVPLVRGDETRLLRWDRDGERVHQAADLGAVRYVPLVPGTTAGPEVGRTGGNDLHPTSDEGA